jgi:hypothetical protein
MHIIGDAAGFYCFRRLYEYKSGRPYLGRESPGTSNDGVLPVPVVIDAFLKT